MKHVIYNLFQNTNTVLLIETNFYKQNQEKSLFLSQMDNFSAVWEVSRVWHIRVLMEENSLCLALRPTQWAFQLIHPSIKRQMLLEKKGCLCLVWTLHPCPVVNILIWTLFLRDGTFDSYWCPSLEHPHCRLLLLSFPMFFVGWE